MALRNFPKQDPLTSALAKGSVARVWRAAAPRDVDGGEQAPLGSSTSSRHKLTLFCFPNPK